MRKYFIDTNVLADLVLDRDGADLAKQILELCNSDRWTHLYTSYLSIANIAFLLRKRSTDDIRKCLLSIMDKCEVLPMNNEQMLSAIRDCNSPDFEDALQIMCAEEKNCDVIITNNVKHFKSFTEIPVLTPSEFLNKVAMSM